MRQDWWAQADQAAWGERQVRFLPEFTAVARRLHKGLEPLGPAQLVHGDLAGNVLFAAGLPAAIIDISPYWRPPAYSDGIVVADALCWHDAPASLLETLDVSRAAVARGLLFRMTTTNQRVLSGNDRGDVADESRRYHRAASALVL